jgi:hypothetical protein
MELKVGIWEESVRHGASADRWMVGWSIVNLGDAPLTILAARAPHGKFRADEKEFTPPVELASNQSGRIELEVLSSEAGGGEVENAFLILRVVSAGDRWLILARLRVYVNGEGKPATTTESITAQPVGFSAKL